MSPLLLLSLLQPGWSQTLSAPQVSFPVPDECSENIPIRYGEELPQSLAKPDGTAACTGVVVPVSQLAYLLQLEEYQRAQERLHMLDIRLLENERDWYRDQYVTLSEPLPWYEKAVTQRWIGRAETLLTVSVVAFGLGYAYDVGRGS
tara:strand:- start:353 stop:793 length:441 start_codon:yes stop_codon:yes gene_type:complete